MATPEGASDMALYEKHQKLKKAVSYTHLFAGHTIDAMVGTSWMREYYRTMGILSLIHI